MAKIALPLAVQNAIWWQNSSEIDIQKDGKMLVKAILQKGNLEAIRFMQSQYSLAFIQSVFEKSYSTEFSPKTLNFWKVVLSTKPNFTSRTDKIFSSPKPQFFPKTF